MEREQRAAARLGRRRSEPPPVRRGRSCDSGAAAGACSHPLLLLARVSAGLGACGVRVFGRDRVACAAWRAPPAAELEANMHRLFNRLQQPLKQSIAIDV